MEIDFIMAVVEVKECFGSDETRVFGERRSERGLMKI
jgi:hypothetical protein